jgi:3-deoxy-manno-octulosonate cytidylyltransferase (CMP-KDO synthetase)
MNYLGIIPARYESTRFPGKPLVSIEGKTMIQRTWEQAGKALDQVIVATDDQRILKAVRNFGGMAVMTSAAHQTGTERCAEALSLISAVSGIDYDVVINIQGDEPFIRPEQILLLAGSFEEEEVQIATLAKKIGAADDIFNPGLPKVVFDLKGNALLFSRSPIPFVRGKPEKEWFGSHTFFRHIGLYAFRSAVLREITRLEPSPLEKAESLEQNRWLENGYRIRVIETLLDTIAIDTPEDLRKIKKAGDGF